MQFSTSLYFGFKKNLFEIILVVYYDNRTGALHPGQNLLFQHFNTFFHHKRKKEESAQKWESTSVYVLLLNTG